MNRRGVYHPENSHVPVFLIENGNTQTRPTAWILSLAASKAERKPTGCGIQEIFRKSFVSKRWIRFQPTPDWFSRRVTSFSICSQSDSQNPKSLVRQCRHTFPLTIETSLAAFESQRDFFSPPYFFHHPDSHLHHTGAMSGVLHLTLDGGICFLSALIF